MISIIITVIIATAFVAVVLGTGIIIGLMDNSAWIFNEDYWNNKKHLDEISKRISNIEEKLKTEGNGKPCSRIMEEAIDEFLTKTEKIIHPSESLSYKELVVIAEQLKTEEKDEYKADTSIH